MNEMLETKILILLTLLSARVDYGEGNLNNSTSIQSKNKKISRICLENLYLFFLLGLLFAYSREGAWDCGPWEGSYEMIRDIKVCRELAESNGLTVTTETESGYPAGCYMNNKKIYFNRHNTGSGERNSKPICTKRKTIFNINLEEMEFLLYFRFITKKS